MRDAILSKIGIAMVRTTTASLIAVTGLLLGLWFFSFGTTGSDEASLSHPEAPSTVGTKEDPDARADYERLRLQNPATGTIPEGIRQRELAFAETLPKRIEKAAAWKQRGPVNVGGRTRALAIDVSNESTILAGGVSGGIWRSTDGGTTWTKTTTPSQLHSVTWIEQDTRSGETSTWYAGTGEYRGNSASGSGASFRGDGIFKSTDGGQTWSLLSSTSTNTPQSFDNLFDYVWKVAIDPSNTSLDEVYAATYGGIHRSTDGGSSWSEVLHGVSTGSPYPRYTDVTVTSGGVVYAALENNSNTSTKGIWQSSDGTSWTDITPSGWPSSYNRIVLALTPQDDLWALMAGSGSGPNGHELWLYDASADSWTDYTSYLPARGGTTGNFNSQNSYDLVVAAHPSDADVVYVGGRNLWRIDKSASASDANTWIGGYTHNNNGYAAYNPTGSDEHHPDQHAITFLPSNGDVMYVGSDGGVHRTDDDRAGSAGSAGDGSVTWTSLNDGYYTTQFYSVCFNPDDSDPAIAGGMQDNGTWSTTSTSPGVNWSEELGADGSFCAITNNSGSGTSRYVSWQNGEVYRNKYASDGSLDGWTRVDPTGASGQLFINPFTLDPTTPTIMYYPAGSTLWRNSDLEGIALSGSQSTTSTNWTEMTGIGSATSSSITALDVSETNSTHVLYYGTSGGSVYRLDNAHNASASASPTDVTGTSFPSGGPYVSGIAVDPTNSDKVMVVFSNYEVKSVFYTSDGGSSWTDVSGDLEQNSDGSGDGPSVRWAAILPQSGLSQTTYYVGTSTGLYSTTSLNGTSTVWSQEGSSTIGNVVVEQVRARTSDGLVLVGTHANGAYSLDAPLPVELTGFDAVTDEHGVRLTWTTVSETDNAGFEVQKRGHQASGKSTEWEAVGFVKGAGTTQASRAYHYPMADLTPGRYQFRLKQVDYDGAFEYSSVVEATVPLGAAYELTAPYPNPSSGTARLTLTVRREQEVRAVAYDMLGRRIAVLFDGSLQSNAPQSLIVEGSRLASGTYVVRVTGETFSTQRKLTVVQ